MMAEKVETKRTLLQYDLWTYHIRTGFSYVQRTHATNDNLERETDFIT